MRRSRIAAVVAVLFALGLAIATAATTPPPGQVLSYVLLTTQADDPGDLANSATKVSVGNLSAQSCSYTVRFLDKDGVQVCQLTKSLSPNQQANFSTNDVPNDVYAAYPNCNPALDDYKGSVEVFVPNNPTCRQLTVVDGYAVTWQSVPNGNLACVDQCDPHGEPLSSRRLTIISMDKYSGKLENGD